MSREQPIWVQKRGRLILTEAVSSAGVWRCWIVCVSALWDRLRQLKLWGLSAKLLKHIETWLSFCEREGTQGQEVMSSSCPRLQQRTRWAVNADESSLFNWIISVFHSVKTPAFLKMQLYIAQHDFKSHNCDFIS